MAGLRDLTVGPHVVPAELLAAHFARSGGPGGQNVNKVASKVDLRLNLTACEAILGVDAVARVRMRLAGRLDADGQLLVQASEHREQARNVEAACARMEMLLTAALHRPAVRRPTRPTRGSKERRLSDKRRRSESKERRRPGGDD